ncbi:hypothetical protein [Zhihengliuella halotolerans]|uniref:Uncharacterized protein n=1 Tax=Zhihengliuella halotolerans TaxID=370736 RepID=A0A4Q8ACG5_9MICC|nr:hypothetical protein [Zhihengliuella halotolerans]RZU61764.1 hypothetical protein EV380_1342 [Zhihengliuella halotolerans]
MSDLAKRLRMMEDDLKSQSETVRLLRVPVTEAEFLGNVSPLQDAVTRALVATADIDSALTRHVDVADSELAALLERQDLAGQAAADMRLAAEAQIEKARAGLADGAPAMEVAAVIAAAFTSLVEAHTYEQAAAHERTREHTRTNDKGESHDEA